MFEIDSSKLITFVPQKVLNTPADGGDNSISVV